MSFKIIKREWTAQEAEEWTKEDTIAIILAPLNYVLLTLGVVLSLLLLPVGFVVLSLGIVSTALMVYVIDPKLTAISRDYEKKQAAYLEELEKNITWEES